MYDRKKFRSAQNVTDVSFFCSVWMKQLYLPALPHVNDSPVHLVACVRVLGRVPDVLFIQSLMPHTVPGVLVLLL